MIPESRLIRSEITIRDMALPEDVLLARKSLIRWIALSLGVARGAYDFEAERTRCLAQIADLASQPIDAPQPRHPMFGDMSGREQSRLQAKHLDYHLGQFGV